MGRPFKCLACHPNLKSFLCSCIRWNPFASFLQLCHNQDWALSHLGYCLTGPLPCCTPSHSMLPGAIALSQLIIITEFCGLFCPCFLKTKMPRLSMLDTPCPVLHETLAVWYLYAPASHSCLQLLPPPQLRPQESQATAQLPSPLVAREGGGGALGVQCCLQQVSCPATSMQPLPRDSYDQRCCPSCLLDKAQSDMVVGHTCP